MQQFEGSKYWTFLCVCKKKNYRKKPRPKSLKQREETKNSASKYFKQLEPSVRIVEKRDKRVVGNLK
jgi:hypothetical protein